MRRKGRKDSMAKVSIWYDEEGDTLEITPGQKKGYFKDIGEDIWERIEDEKIVGVTILNFKKRQGERMRGVELPVEMSFLEAAKE